MKKKAKWLILLLVSVVMMLITGCGGEVRTSSETKVDENWAGTRTITSRFSRSTFNRETDDTITSLDKLVQANCPPQLEWERVLRSGYYEYIFQLNFTSMEDYKQKVEAIIGEPNHVTIETVDNLYEEQVVLKEDIEPSDLLIWLKKALAQEKNQSLTNIEKLFREYTNSLFCNGTRMELDDDDYLNYTKDRHVQFTGIDFITDITSDNLFHRTIEMRMVLDISEEKQAKIREVFASRLPEGATGTWGEKDNQTFYQAAMQNMTPEQLTNFTNAVMDCQTKGMESVSTSDGMLQFRQDFEEAVDLSSYFVGDSDELPFLYYAKASDGILLQEFSADESEQENSQSEYEDETSDELSKKEFPVDDNGYQVLFDDDMDNGTISFSFDNSYIISEIHVTTDVGWNNKFERTIILNYDRVPLQKEQESIQTTMQEAANGLSNINLQTEKDVFGIVVKHSGDAEAVTNAFQTVFQSDSYIRYEQDYTGLFRFAMPYQFEEKLNFEHFITQKETPALIYRTNFLNGEKVEENENSPGKVSADGKGYEETADDLSVDISVVATQQSYLPIFLIVLGVLIVGTVLLLIIRFIRNSIKKRKSYPSIDQNAPSNKQVNIDKKEEFNQVEKTSQEKVNETFADQSERSTKMEKDETPKQEGTVQTPEGKQKEFNMWKPPAEQNTQNTATEPKDIDSVRGVKKRAEIPTIYEDKKRREKRLKELEAEARLKKELEKTLAKEVNKTIDQGQDKEE